MHSEIATDNVEMLLRSFRLPTFASLYEPTVARAEAEGWSHRQLLAHLCQSEAADRTQRRIERLWWPLAYPKVRR